MDNKLGLFASGDSNTATQVIDFAKDQIAKLTDEFKGAAPGEYDPEIANGILDVMKKLIEAAVRIEALNTIPRLNIENDDMIEKIYRESIFKNDW